MQLTDSHCHLDVPAFDHDRTEVLARARAAGVTRIVVPAIAAANWQAVADTCRLGPGLYPAYGLHPVFLDQHQPDDLEALRAWLEREQPVAIGECGLDWHLPGLDRQRQADYFDAQLRLAREFDLPVIVHARRAVEAVIMAVRRIGGLRGVVHSYSGSPEQARQLADNGFLIGLGGPVTHAGAHRLHRLAAHLPLECLLLETDAPDQPDAGHQGQRNEPAALGSVCRTIAELRGVSPDEVALATSSNATRLFGLLH